MYIEIHAEFKNMQKKKILNRSANHYISPGIEPRTSWAAFVRFELTL